MTGQTNIHDACHWCYDQSRRAVLWSAHRDDNNKKRKKDDDMEEASEVRILL